MNKQKKVLALVLALVMLLTMLTGCGGGDDSAEGGEKITVTVTVVHGDGSKKDFTLETAETTLGRAMVEGGIVEDNQTAYGLYILTADGETVNESNQEWWSITKDGEALMTGADDTDIVDGEEYVLTFTVGY